MFNLIKINFKILFQNKLIVSIFFVCLFISIITSLFSFKIIYGEQLIYNEYDEFEIKESIDFIILELDKKNISNVKIYLSDDLYFMYKDSNTTPILGNKLEADKYEVLINDFNIKINDFVEILGNNYVVKGYNVVNEISFTNDLKEFESYKIHIKSSYNINEFLGQKAVLYETEGMLDLIFKSPLIFLLLTMILLSFVMFFMCFSYVLAKRRRVFKILNLYLTNRYCLIISVFIELIFLITVIFIMASLSFYALEKIILNDIIDHIFLKKTSSLGFLIYIIIYCLFVFSAILSIFLNISRLVKKEVTK